MCYYVSIFRDTYGYSIFQVICCCFVPQIFPTRSLLIISRKIFLHGENFIQGDCYNHKTAYKNRIGICDVLRRFPYPVNVTSSHTLWLVWIFCISHNRNRTPGPKCVIVYSNLYKLTSISYSFFYKWRLKQQLIYNTKKYTIQYVLW